MSVLPPCRICSTRPADSDEHFIPKAAGNKLLVMSLSIADDGSWKERPLRGGAKVPVLCGACNKTVASPYAQAYTHLYRQLRAAPRITVPDGRRVFHIRRLCPLRVIKQAILGYLCIAAWEPELVWEPLQHFVRNREEALPASAPHIYLYFNSSHFGRVVPYCVIGSLATHESVPMAEISWPPLGIVLSHSPNHPALSEMQDVTEWGALPFAAKQDVSLVLPELRVSSIYPLAFGGDHAVRRHQAAHLPFHLVNAPPESTSPFKFPTLLRRG